MCHKVQIPWLFCDKHTYISQFSCRFFRNSLLTLSPLSGFSFQALQSDSSTLLEICQTKSQVSEFRIRCVLRFSVDQIRNVLDIVYLIFKLLIKVFLEAGK